MTHFFRFAVAAVLCHVPLLSWSQINCQIRVFQDQQEVFTAGAGSVQTFKLKASEFQLEISPTACSPTIATVPNVEVARQIAEKPLIYAPRWVYLIAALPEDSDKLLWWSRSDFPAEFRTPPSDSTFDGKQYLQLCEELRFCPNAYPIFSSGQPFVDAPTGSKSVATFKRLDGQRVLADAKGKGVLSVVYTLWRSLPAEFSMADPRPLLFRPHFIQFLFSED